MSKLFWAAFIAALCLSVGLALSYGGEDSSPKPAPGATGDTWMDPTSGLTWQAAPTGGKMNWSDAKAHCKSLSLGGRNDWRLPTINELRSLIRGCLATQKGGACGVTASCLKTNTCWKIDTCKGCSEEGGPGPAGAYWPPELAGEVGSYWSSSPVADLVYNAWDVDFSRAYVIHSYVNYGNSARCVRP